MRTMSTITMITTDIRGFLAGECRRAWVKPAGMAVILLAKPNQSCAERARAGRLNFDLLCHEHKIQTDRTPKRVDI